LRDIDPYLNEKLESSEQTIYNNAEPKMSIQVSRARTTVMDSSYWTVETIREKERLGDLSITARRQRSYGHPDRIYEIHVDNGIVKTAVREYPDYLKQGWKVQFDLGPGSSVAIAFDGEWVFYRKKWRIVTYEKPYIFWVDNTGKLLTQLWDETDTLIELATGVSKVKAIRAWKNMNFIDQDQGVVAGYIKNDGLVYYRNLCKQADGNTIWESERRLISFAGTAVNLNLFITNDFRLGFVIEDSSGTSSWHITNRNWAGMAIYPEKLLVKPGVKIDFIETNKVRSFNRDTFTVAPQVTVGNLLFGRTDNELLSLINVPNEENDWGWIIEFRIKYESVTLPAVTLTNLELDQPIVIDRVEYRESNRYLIYISDVVESGINNIFGDIKVEISGLFNEAGYEYEVIEKTFTPINLVPVNVPIPEVEVIWNE
jgi:hypothetical protein